MRRFHCAHCDAEVFFTSTTCEACHYALIFDPQRVAFLAEEALETATTRVCANRELISCNWVSGSETGLCCSCELTTIFPNLDAPGNQERWARLEAAKRQVISALDQLGLDHPSKPNRPESGVEFRFLADDPSPTAINSKVLTGHENGVIVVNVVEADDAIREQRRTALNEPFRTLVGHIRHELGHYYWERLIQNEASLATFRTLFGDERQDYAQALSRYYQEGPSSDWQSHFVSAYSSCHPWEDFAETWAHYLHIVDGLQTAIAFGLATPSADQGQVFDETFPYLTTVPFNQIATLWGDVAIAVNALNRSLGQPDLYPFVLSNEALEKLAFVHEIIVSRAGQQLAAA